MAYEGVLGKLGSNLFEGSGQGGMGFAKYTGLGAGSLGLYSGIKSSLDENDEGKGFTDGLMNGLVAGAFLGGAVNLAPKAIKSSLDSSGFTMYKNLDKVGDEAAKAFRPVYEDVNNKENKELLKSFKPVAKDNIKKIREPYVFSKDVTDGLIDTMADFEKETQDKLLNMGSKVDTIFTDFTTKNKRGVDFKNYLEDTRDKFNSMSRVDKIKNGGSFIAKAGFDSAYHHVVAPTGQFIKKATSGRLNEVTKLEGAAAAFSAYGGYEAYQMANEIADGDYSGALKTGMVIGAGKLAFSQGVNLIHANAFLKERNMTWGGVAAASGTGYALKQYATGLSKWTADDHTGLVKKMAEKGLNVTSSP